jgi:threonine/homoserine/homoserine lactone efflux protein
MMYEGQPAREERSLGELLGDLAEEVKTLVRQEATLAKQELSQKAASVGKDVGMVAAGGAVLYAGVLAIIAAIIIGLAQAGMPWWASALLVGIIVTAAGGALAWMGVNALKQEDLTPRQTLETLSEIKNEPTNVRNRAARPG